MFNLLSWSHIKGLFIFALPLIAGQVGQMLFGVGDIMVAGRYSNEVLSALGISVGIFAPFLMVGIGATFAISPIAAKFIGEKRERKDLLPNALLIATFLSFVLFIILSVLLMNISILGFDKNIEKLILDYLWPCSFSILPVLIFQTLKEYLQAYEDTYFSNGLILFFNLINISLNFILIFGFGPIPELGIIGAAYATIISRTSMCLVLLAYTIRKKSFLWKKCYSLMRELLNLGVPIGAGTLIEVLVFSVVTVLIGKMSILASASHNIVLNLASMTFMVPLAMSSAVSVKVGTAFGQKDQTEIIKWTLAGLCISISFMCVFALTYLTIPNLLVRFATDDAELIKYSSGLLLFVGLFQVPDGIQVTLLGVLRGLGITKRPMFFAFAANWLLGLPTGLFLSHYWNMEAAGLWAGLAVGLSALSLLLSLLFIRTMKNSSKLLQPILS